jgi:hypothetical protein
VVDGAEIRKPETPRETKRKEMWKEVEQELCEKRPYSDPLRKATLAIGNTSQPWGRENNFENMGK